MSDGKEPFAKYASGTMIIGNIHVYLDEETAYSPDDIRALAKSLNAAVEAREKKLRHALWVIAAGGGFMGEALGHCDGGCGQVAAEALGDFDPQQPE